MTRFDISRYPFIPTKPLMVAMNFFSFFFQNSLRSFPKRRNTIKKIASHELSRRTNTANKIYELQIMQTKLQDFAKKVLVIDLGPPKISRNRRTCQYCCLILNWEARPPSIACTNYCTVQVGTSTSNKVYNKQRNLSL